MPCSGRKHTPIVSAKQQRLFGHWKSHPESRPKGITAKEVDRHLAESEGKDLVETTKKRMRKTFGV